MNGIIRKIEHIHIDKGVTTVEFEMFDISEKDFLLLQECLNSHSAWRIEISKAERDVKLTQPNEEA